jgi:hypothetical protein
MGPTVALLVRIGASAVVLGVPTFLMGGTLPAVVRAVENDADLGRRTLALFYGLNTIGGVCGVILATFFLLELLGTRMTIWSGSLLNLLVGFAALFLATRIGAAQGEEASNLTPGISCNGTDETGLAITSSTVLSPNFIYGAAFLVGFSFFIMEIVWNRMLTPLLGGSVYSFGLVIAVVLAGIGLGGWIYSIGNKRLSATVQTLAVTLSLEALALAVPFALGDRLAILAALLRPFGEIGFDNSNCLCCAPRFLGCRFSVSPAGQSAWGWQEGCWQAYRAYLCLEHLWRHQRCPCRRYGSCSFSFRSRMLGGSSSNALLYGRSICSEIFFPARPESSARFFTAWHRCGAFIDQR